MKIQLFERMDRNEIPPDDNKNRRPTYGSFDRWTYASSGKLSLIINEYWDGNDQKKWGDTSRKSLEEQLNEVIIGLVVAAKGLRARRIKREEDEKRRRVRERRWQEEMLLRKHFEGHAEAWRKVQQLRNFLQACEASIQQRLGAITSDSPEARWLAWAINYVDELDPLTNGSFEEIFGTGQD